MTQTTSRFFDDMARLMSDAAGVADGVRKEIETMIRTQGERMLQELNLVTRDEFDAVQAMAQQAREENEALAERITQLEAMAHGHDEPSADPQERSAE